MTEPLNLPFSWMGTKYNLRRVLLPLIAAIPRKLYVEPYVGAGGLFFGKEPEKAEVINDRNRCIINVFRCMRNKKRLRDVLELLCLTPHSRSEYYALAPIVKRYFAGEDFDTEARDAGLDDYDDETVAAFAFLYVQNCGYAGGGQVAAFGGGAKGKDAARIISGYRRARERLPEFAARLESVTLENLDALECVRKYDHETTLFYLDPPYNTPSSAKYGAPWGDSEDAALVDCLENVKGSFILTVYDNDTYQRLLTSGAECVSIRKKTTMPTKKEAMTERKETIYFKSRDNTLQLKELLNGLDILDD